MPGKTINFHGETFPAPVNDQWDFLLSTIWDQMIHLVITLGGSLDEERLACAMRSVLATEPVLRSRFLDSRVPCWEELPALSTAAFFSLLRADDPEVTLRHVLLQRIDPRSGPQARLTLIRGRKDTLVLSVNHTASDACGVRDTAARIARFYRECRGKSTLICPCIPPGERSYAPIFSFFSPADREKARRACGDSSAEWGIPCIPGQCQSPCHTWKRITPDLFRRVRSLSRLEGLTINDLLLSAFFQSVSREIPHTDGRNYPVLTTVDLRRMVPGVPAPAVANLSVAFEVRLPADRSLSPLFHARETHRAMEEKKGNLAGLGAAIRLQERFEGGFSRVRESLEDLARASRTEGYLKNPFFSNTGIIPPECTDFGDMKAVSAFLVPPVDYPPGFSVAASTFGETLTLASGFCRDSVPAAVVEKVLQGIEDLLRTMVG
ncbi:MAG TPA: hypothetical protein PK445_06435 [Methanolinea sp.]|nr:hypothetical protein [Methanolinea sp.]HQE86017.1 hypothetical protein [Methanolinea sp.]HQI14899.1 hypothetical protein [Methanolinea sp.]